MNGLFHDSGEKRRLPASNLPNDSHHLSSSQREVYIRDGSSFLRDLYLSQAHHGVDLPFWLLLFCQFISASGLLSFTFLILYHPPRSRYNFKHEERISLTKFFISMGLPLFQQKDFLHSLHIRPKFNPRKYALIEPRNSNHSDQHQQPINWVGFRRSELVS